MFRVGCLRKYLPLVARAALRVFGKTPRPIRRVLVWCGSPKYVVGALGVVVLDSRYCLLRQPHGLNLNLPGGLRKRGETPARCLEREIAEELGFEVTSGTQPDAVLVDERARRIDLVFKITLLASARFEISSVEVTEVLWLPIDDVRIRGTARAAVDAVEYPAYPTSPPTTP